MGFTIHRVMNNNKIEQKLERMNNIQLNRKPIEKVDFFYSDGTRDDYKIGEMTNFIKWHKKIIRFVDWTTNTIHLRTDVKQPLYLTDPEGHANTFEDRTALSLLGED